jgi:hypothetical protein
LHKGANVSNFTCIQCDRDNLDSESGYYRGCEHYPPEKDGTYRVTLELRDSPNLNDSTRDGTRIFKSDEWQLKNFEKVIAWRGI